MGILEVLFGIVLSVFGYAFYQRSKGKSAESLLENLDVKENLLKNDKVIVENAAKEEHQSEIRKQLKSDINEEKENEESLEDLENYFNKRKPD